MSLIHAASYGKIAAEVIKMQKKAVLFDLDGTLVNSLPDISRCMNAALASHGLPVHAMEAYNYFVGNGAVKLSERAVGAEHPELVASVLDAYRDMYAAHCFDDSYVYEGIRELLSELKADGYRLVVLSNKDDGDVQTVIRHYFPELPFEIMRGKLPGGTIKPDPAGAINIAAEMGLNPDEFWYLGDTPVDYATCRDAGMHFIAVTYGFRTADELHAAGARTLAATPAEALAIIRAK